MVKDEEAAPARTRRRGEALEHAIRLAALAELADVGYFQLTMEGIAARARTGKAALYRRWPSKRQLVFDALRHALPSPHEFDPSQSTRDNLLLALTVMNEVLAGQTSFPSVTVLGEVLHENTLRQAFVDAVIAPRLHTVESILRHGAERGETRHGPVAALIARTGPALLLQTFLLTGEAATQDELVQIVDTILMPLASPSHP